MHLLSEPDVAQVLRGLSQPQCHSLLSTLSQALITTTAQSTAPPSSRLIHQPLRTAIATNDQTLKLFMPVSNTATTSCKIVTVSQSHGVLGVINIFSPEGKLLGLLSAAEITAFRTALAIMALFVRCPSLKKESIVVFGSGRQAEWHARLALLLFPEQVRRIVFVNRGRKRLDEMAPALADLRALYAGVTIDAVAREDTPDYENTLRGILRSCDVIFSCTPATEPNFAYEDINDGRQRFVSLIGSYRPHMREIDTETLLSGGGKVYVDSKEACLEESGELIAAGMKEDSLIEIGELFGREDGAGPDVRGGQNVVYKCVGMGIMDLVIGTRLLEIGREKGTGMEVDGF